VECGKRCPLSRLGKGVVSGIQSKAYISTLHNDSIPETPSGKKWGGRVHPSPPRRNAPDCERSSTLVLWCRPRLRSYSGCIGMYLAVGVTIGLYLFAFAAWRHRRVATPYTAVEDWTECAQTDRWADRQTKVRTVYPPVSLRSLGGYA